MWNRRQDRAERAIRGAPQGQCYFCEVSGKRTEATHGQLCKRHFEEVNFPKPLPLLDY